MRIQPQHLEFMRKAVNGVFERHPNLVRDYETGNFPRADKVKDLQKRFCFDVMHGAGLSGFVSKELYKYVNDDHIYTALKAICPNESGGVTTPLNTGHIPKKDLYYQLRAFLAGLDTSQP
jgi:hypothetical protein